MRIFGLIGLAIVVGIGIFVFAGGDPVAELLNKRWPPITVDQQRQNAIASGANALSLITTPNVAVGIDTKTIIAIAQPQLESFGVGALRVKSDRQLLRIEADFARKFGPTDLPADSDWRALVEKLKPDVAGTIVAFVGITSPAPEAQGQGLQLKLLPAFNGLHITKVKLADSMDATASAEVIASLLTRYAENVTGALEGLTVLDVALPTSPFETVDPSGPINFSIPDAPDVRLTLTSRPINFPFRPTVHF